MRRRSAILKFSRCDTEVNVKEEIVIPSPYAEQLEKLAEEQGMAADEIAENAIRKYLKRGEADA